MYLSGMTTRDIAKDIGIPSRTVARYLKNAGVQMRNPGALHHTVLDDSDLLRQMYLVEGLSTTQIAAEVGASSRVVHTWLKRHGIKLRGRGSEIGHTRTTPEARRLMSKRRRGKFLGADNPNWKGGEWAHDPERNRFRAKQWSKAIRERDGKCVECGCEENLHAHHIKRWKDYPELRYDLSNGVTLCEPCHQKAHGKNFKFRWNQ